jgi:hypothetical protein
MRESGAALAFPADRDDKIDRLRRVLPILDEVLEDGEDEGRACGA